MENNIEIKESLNTGSLNTGTLNTEPLKKPEPEIIKADLVFVGGGPSVLSFLSLLFQYKYAQKVFSCTNILIIEKSDKFGSGCLGEYGINTNTAAEGFTRLICNPRTFSNTFKDCSNNIAGSTCPNSNCEIKEEKEPENEFEDDNDKEQKIFEPLPFFGDMFKCAPAQSLINIGNKPGPLCLVGYYLDCVGNYMIDLIARKFNKNILMNNTEVESIKMYKNDEFGIYLKRNNQNITVKCRNVVMATGGRQKTPRNLEELQKNIKDPDDIYLSNCILREDGYNKLFTTLTNKPIPENPEERKKKRIVIIGGSHSGFSCAWILLNGPSTYKNILIGEEYTQRKKANCELLTCKEQCICYGKVYDKIWKNSEAYNPEDIEIQILYKDRIKVFYASEEEALANSYYSFNNKTDCNGKGRVYPFVGIRADAKILYSKIIKGEEKRVQLIKTKTTQEQYKYINDCDAVIWACGYETDSLNIYDYRNNLVDCSLGEDGMYDIDSKLRLMNRNKMPFKNLFGIGQGYSMYAPEVINGKKARGDSVHLYNTITARKLYKTLEDFFNKKVYDAREKSTNALKSTLRPSFGSYNNNNKELRDGRSRSKSKENKITKPFFSKSNFEKTAKIFGANVVDREINNGSPFEGKNNYNFSMKEEKNPFFKKNIEKINFSNSNNNMNTIGIHDSRNIHVNTNKKNTFKDMKEYSVGVGKRNSSVKEIKEIKVDKD